MTESALAASDEGEHWIVIGAGSAGCVLANRLSDRPDRFVTLIDDGPALEPGRVPPGIEGSSFLAALEEPGRLHVDLLATRSPGIAPTLYRRGRGVGGSSAVNAMVALRGSPSLYRSWGWHDVDAAWDRVEIPTMPADDTELGPVDRALLDADERTERAELTRANGRRVSSAEAYLWPAIGRPNLVLRTDIEAEAVCFDADRVARGVHLADGTEIEADRVVVAAGAIHSPALLLRSGVDTTGVGCGLQDHPSAVLTLGLSGDVVQDPAGLVIASVFHADIGDDIIQLLPLNHLGGAPGTEGLAALLVALMTPRSQSGTVQIDAGGAPVVDFDFLSDERDLDALIAGVRLGLDMVQRPPFDRIVEQVFIDDRGTTAAALVDDAAIASWLRERCGDYVHATSTCAMGTVVDDDFAVVGYANLYVCDASVFPTVPDANTHLPTTMLAERFALRHA